MEDINIIGNDPSFEKYLNKVIEISQVSPREINYQLEIVKPLLEKLLPDHQIADTSNNSGDTKLHTRESYTLEGHAAPDLLIAKNFKYKNRNDKAPEIFAAIEVKEQSSYEMCNKDISNYDDHLIYELSLFLYKNKRVIATNCRRWQFFYKNTGFNNELVKTFLYDFSNKKGSDKTPEIRDILEKCCINTIDVLPNKGMIKPDTEEKEPDVFIQDLLDLKSEKSIIIPDEWNELIHYLPRFIEL